MWFRNELSSLAEVSLYCSFIVSSVLWRLSICVSNFCVSFVDVLVQLAYYFIFIFQIFSLYIWRRLKFSQKSVTKEYSKNWYSRSVSHSIHLLIHLLHVTTTFIQNTSLPKIRQQISRWYPCRSSKLSAQNVRCCPLVHEAPVSALVAFHHSLATPCSVHMSWLPAIFLHIINFGFVFC